MEVGRSEEDGLRKESVRSQLKRSLTGTFLHNHPASLCLGLQNRDSWMCWKTSIIYRDGRGCFSDGVIILDEGDGAGTL